MPQPTWQKSSFSGGGEGECVELAEAAPAGRICIRESDQPRVIAITVPIALAGLLGAIKSGAIDSGSH